LCIGIFIIRITQLQNNHNLVDIKCYINIAHMVNSMQN